MIAAACCGYCRKFSPEWRERPPAKVAGAAEQMAAVPVFGRCGARQPPPLTESAATCGQFEAMAPRLEMERRGFLARIAAEARYREPGDPLAGKFGRILSEGANGGQ